MSFNFAVSRVLLSRFSASPSKDSFSEESKLELFLELNHLNTLSVNDCVNWQLMKVWSSSPQNEQSLSCLISKRNNLRNGKRAAYNHGVMDARGRLLSTKEA